MEPHRLPASRWTLCIPRYCPYAQACPIRPPRQRRVETSRCLRYAPEEARPQPGLSPFARAVLEKLRRTGGSPPPSWGDEGPGLQAAAPLQGP